MSDGDARQRIALRAKELARRGQSSGAHYAHQDLRKVNTALIPLLAAGGIAALSLGWKANAIGPVLLWVVACLAVGALAGFLFGIPRAAARPDVTGTDTVGGVTSAKGPAAKSPSSSKSRPNTNLEEVSDWLTKILVGLALVNLAEIELRVQAVARNMASALGPKLSDANVSTATALIVSFTVLGFLASYLYTRLFLQGAIRRSDDDLQRFNEVLFEEFARTTGSPLVQPSPGQPTIPSPTERTSAERVAGAVPGDRPDAVVAPLYTLADEYNKVRQEMVFGPERTRRMTEIASRMRQLGLAAVPNLQQFANGETAGERLAAVMILQMRFDENWTTWLADRLVDDAAFIGYQAASALLARLPAASATEKALIRSAVEAVRPRIPYPEVQRDRLVERILSSVAGAAKSPESING